MTETGEDRRGECEQRVDRPVLGPRRRAALRSAGALAAIASVAGCGGLLGGDGGTNDGAGDGTTGPSTRRGDGADATATEAFDLSPAECEAELDDLEGERDELEAELVAAEADLDWIADADTHLVDILEYLEDKPASVISDAEAIVPAVREAVVYLELDGGSATGWFVDDTHVLTNAHNVVDEFTGEPQSAPTIWTIDGDRSGSTVVGYEPNIEPDVALLEADMTAPASLDFAPGPAGNGEYLLQVGHPGGVGNWIVSLGEVLQADYRIGNERSVLTDVPGSSGVSGSPVVNLDGDVVGMTSGSHPKESHDVGERPGVHPSIVYDRPLPQQGETIHVGLADVTERYEAWT